MLLVVTVMSARSSARSVEASWGSTSHVLVAQDRVEIGQSARDLLASEPRPVGVLPVDAVIEEDLVAVGALTALRRLEPGDIITRRDLVGFDDERRLDDSQRALNVPTGPATPELLPGDAVELIVVVDRFGSEGDAPVRPVAGLILNSTPDAVTVSVNAESVVRLAEAQSDQRLVIVRR